jgi:hypothetical protein
VTRRGAIGYSTVEKLRRQEICVPAGLCLYASAANRENDDAVKLACGLRAAPDKTARAKS